MEIDIAMLCDETGALKRATIAERITALEREIAGLEQDPDVLRWSDEGSR